MADRYPHGSLEAFVERVNATSPAPVALGITDYLSLRCYLDVRTEWQSGNLPGIKLLFPNIEFRISPPTSSHKGVNVHLLVDPSDPDHVSRVQAHLGLLTFRYDGNVYRCDEEGITRFARAADPSIQDTQAAYRYGINEFKIEFNDFRRWYEQDRWLRDNTVVAISNKERDGVSGLPKEHGFGATIEEMFRFTRAIFSGNPSDREFWLGRGADSHEELHRRFGGLKPCLHGSDAHALDEVLAPAGDRYCWIRAEPTFEGLRQVIYEPEGRVAIGTDPPARARDIAIHSISVQAPWFPTEPIELNEGLVSIIGPRGSGKTALADLIAHGADAFDDGPASFLGKALPLAAGVSVALAWSDGRNAEARYLGSAPEDLPSVRYLSQHFVEQLCSEDGASARLVNEIESVVFNALDVTDRGEASSFPELRDALTASSDRRIADLRDRISECSTSIAREQTVRIQQPAKQKRLGALRDEICRLEAGVAALVVKDNKEKVERFQKLQEEAAALEEGIARLKDQHRRLGELERDLDLKTRTIGDDFDTLRMELIELGIRSTDLDQFRMKFSGDYKLVIKARQNSLSAEVAVLLNGPQPPEPSARPLTLVRTDISNLQREIGGDAAKATKLVSLQATLKSKAQERTRLEAELKHAQGAQGRIEAAHHARLDHYLQIFEEFARQRTALAELYKPLQGSLSADSAEHRNLAFRVRQLVDVEAWAARGEELLDLRRKTEFQEPGSLLAKANELLAAAWRVGDLDAIREAMGRMVELFRDAKQHLRPTTTLEQFADWLFSTDHVRIAYGIRFEGKEISQLSPGTRGIVLLILYLSLDSADERPLIIDQPEENLDPKSIHDVLTRYFRESRKRRQVILVTHNANLVVNTDSDQVIVASADSSGAGLPRFTYAAGGLEDPDIRRHICEILEGGEQAFLTRARRYGYELTEVRR